MEKGRSSETKIEEAALNAKFISKKGQYFPDVLKEGEKIFDDPEMITDLCTIDMYKEEVKPLSEYLQLRFQTKFGLSNEDFKAVAEKCLEMLVFLAENNTQEE